MKNDILTSKRRLMMDFDGIKSFYELPLVFIPD